MSDVGVGSNVSGGSGSGSGNGDSAAVAAAASTGACWRRTGRAHSMPTVLFVSRLPFTGKDDEPQKSMAQRVWGWVSS
ncbi:hypothetical protein HZH66_007037 [Vespula vulgaris]|uniref:Uncharacterized protein n=1 Tax=Vespula vulgaris TaxID=7454 RepID=A0A834JXV6_VESVU|nr:hypothetical protein HZH66_007037 [Vespula vulgaris]